MFPTSLLQEFKLKAQLARHCQVAHGLSLRTAGIRGIGMKTRIAFALKTTPMTKLSRILCKDMLKLRHISRCPFDAVDVMAVKQECKYFFKPKFLLINSW